MGSAGFTCHSRGGSAVEARALELGKHTANGLEHWSDVGLIAKQTLRDLWLHKNLGAFDANYSAEVLAHGVLLLRASSGILQGQETGH